MRFQIIAWTLAVGLVGGFAAMAAKAPQSVVIKECQKVKPPVTFPHAQHVKQKIPCKTCHHTGDTAKACTSAGCHAGKAEGKRPGCAEMSMTKNPFHIRCVGCHKKEGKGPKACAQCHKK